MPSKQKRQKAKAKHRRDKRRARYRKVFSKYTTIIKEPGGPDQFPMLLSELLQLNVKYLQQLSSDLKQGYISPWSGDYHRLLVHTLDMSLMERTLLK